MKFRHRLLALVPPLSAAVLMLAPAGHGASIRITSKAVSLNASRPAMNRVGGLLYRGGLVLRAEDRRFGGLSGLAISGDGMRMMAVTDTGQWIGAALTYDPRGRLAGISNAKIRPLLGPGGRRYGKKRLHDAEALTTAGDMILVGFEHWHRIWAYPRPDSRRDWNAMPRSFATPKGLRRAPPNQGLEALAALGNGRFFLLTEGLKLPGGGVRGWIGRPGDWRAIRYRPGDRFRPTAAARLPDGDILVVERHVSLLTGLSARIVRVPRARLAHDSTVAGTLVAMLQAPLAVDNFEGIAVRRNRAGGIMIYLISDNNFSILQRTLLLMFELAG